MGYLRSPCFAMKPMLILLLALLATPPPLLAQERRAPVVLQVPAELSATHQIALYGQRLGLYQQEGLELRVVVVKASLALATLLSGASQFTTQFSNPFYAGMQGAKVKSIMVIFDRPNWHLVAGPGIKTAKDLKGKAVSVFSLGGANHYSTMRAVAHLGLDPERDVTYIALGGEKEQLAALKAGSVQASGFKTPWDLLAKQYGGKELLFTGDILEFPTNGLGTTDKLLKETPQLAKRMIRATLRTMKAIKEQPAETTDFFGRLLKLDRALAAASREDLIRTMSADGAMSERGLKALIEAGKLSGSIKGDANPEKGFDFTLLRELQREKVL